MTDSTVPEAPEACVVVRLVAYLMGNPWPICHDCKRHVHLDEATGEWRHFK